MSDQIRPEVGKTYKARNELGEVHEVTITHIGIGTHYHGDDGFVYREDGKALAGPQYVVSTIIDRVKQT